MSTAVPAAPSPGARADLQVRLLGASRESTVSLSVLRGLIEAVARAGGPSGRLLRAARLEPQHQQAADARIPRREVYRLCELAMDLTGDPALGLHWAERLTERAFVPVSHLIAHAPTLRHALAALAQFYRLLSDETGYQVVESDAAVTLRVLPLLGESARMQRFVAEMMVVGFFRLLRDFGVQARPQRVCFDYAAPAHQAEYTRVFERPPCFEQAFTGIVFDRALLDLPGPHEDADVHEALQSVAERRLSSIIQRTSYTQRVREYLVRCGGPHNSGMDEAARALDLSVRSLRRRLTAEGTAYQAVANEALMAVARHLLLDKRRTIQETAYALGFSDARGFHRAFRRFTGTTPSLYRRAQQPGAAP